MGRKSIDEEFNVEMENKRDYTAISPKKRQKLIEFVTDKKMTIYKAAKRLGLKHPTAKSIIKSYRKAHQCEEFRQKITKEGDKESISDNRSKDPSETQQKNLAGAHPSQKEPHPYQNTLPSCGVTQYQYLWRPYCMYTTYSWNYS